MTTMQPSWPPGDGGIAARIREHDWAATPLGPIESWPPSLRTAVELCLNLRFPSTLLWGPTFVFFHNDAHIPFLGNAVAGALGAPAARALADTWPAVEGRMAEIMATGQGVVVADRAITFDRGSGPSEAYFTLSSSPVHDETGRVAGVLTTGIETTERVRALDIVRASEARQSFLLQLSDALRPLSDALDIQETAVRLLGEYLGVDWAYYGESDAHVTHMTVQREFTHGGATSLIGIHPFTSPEILEWLKQGRVIDVDDLHTSPLVTDDARALYGGFGVRSFIGAPIIKSGTALLAILVVSAREPRRWRPDEIELVSDVADRTWAAVARARAEASLRASDAILQSFYLAAPQMMGVGEVDGERLIAVSANPATAAFFQTPIDALAGRSGAELGTPHEIDAFWLARIRESELRGEPVRFEYMDTRFPDCPWLAGTVMTLGMGPTNRLRYSFVAEDVTERKRREANEALLLGISHELVGLTSVAATMDLLGATIGAHFGVQQCVFAEFVDANTVRVPFAWHAPGAPDLTGTYDVHDFFSPEQIARQNAGELSVVSDMQTDARFSAENYGALDIRSGVIVPLARLGQWRFLLTILDNRVRVWRDDEIALIQEIVDRVWARLERARAEDALRESEARLQLALDAAEMGTFVWFPQEDRTEPDARMLALFGVPEDGVLDLANALATMIHPDDRAPYARAVAEAADPQGDGSLDAEIRVLHPDGSLHWIVVSAQMVFQGNPPRAARLYGTAADITDRKATEETVRLNQERQEFLLRLSDALRPLGDATEIQDVAARMLGEALDADRTYYLRVEGDYEWAVIERDFVRGEAPSVVGKHAFADFASVFDAYRVGRVLVLDDVEAPGAVPRTDLPAFRALAIRSLVSTPLVKDDQTVVSMTVLKSVPHAWTDFEVGLVQEVAERTWAAVERAYAEEALRASETRYRTLFESIDEGYALYELLYDEDSHPHDLLVLEANPAYRTLTDRPDPVGKTLKALATSPSQQWLAELNSVALSGVPRRYERHNPQNDRWFEVYIAPAPAEGKNRIYLVFNDITERKRSTQALQQSEERYRTLFDSIEQGFCTIEVLFDDAGQAIDYRFLEINPTFARNTGLDDAVGKRARDLLPDLEDSWFRIYGQVALTRESVRFEDGSDVMGRWFTVYAFPIGAPEQHRVAILFEDITARRTADSALRASESRYRTLVQNLPDYAISLLDPGGVITEWSEGAERITGFTSDEALGQDVALLYSDEAVSAGEPAQELAEAALTGRVERESWLQRKDGARFWGNEIATAIRNEAGQLVGYTKISRDLTERRQADAALQASEERVRAIVEAATDYAIFTVDAAGLIQDWFPGAAAVFGWSAEDAVGASFAATFTPEDQAAGEPERELAQARRHGSAPDVRWHQHKNGSRVFIDGVTRARFDLDGTFLGALKIGRDATAEQLADQRRAEQDEQTRRELQARVAAATQELRALSHRLLMVQEEERRFLARELHDEIGQMLTGLSLTLSTTATRDQQLVEAQRIVAELTQHVRQLSMDLRPTALDAYGVLPTLRGHIERYEAQTGIAVDLRAAGLDRRFSAPVEITAYRIVQEALTNAARHSQASHVLVQLFADEQTLTVSIRDRGRGFDPSHVHGTSGLGGMRERAELLGGALEVDTSPGAGVQITAELPLGNGDSHDLA